MIGEVSRTPGVILALLGTGVYRIAAEARIPWTRQKISLDDLYSSIQTEKMAEDLNGEQLPTGKVSIRLVSFISGWVSRS